jgi:hypothetical protein
MKNIYFIILALIAFIYIIHEVRKKKFSIKESFWWVVAAIVMLFLAIFPYSIDYLAHIFNVAYGPSLLFVLCIVFLVFINFRNSKKIAEQQEKIIELAQELAIIKAEKNEKK